MASLGHRPAQVTLTSCGLDTSLSFIVLVYEMGFCEKKPLGGSQEPVLVNTPNGTTVGGGLTTCRHMITAPLVEVIYTFSLALPIIHTGQKGLSKGTGIESLTRCPV